MEINGNHRPVDPAARKRQFDAGKVAGSLAASGESQAADQADHLDAFKSLSISREELQRYVDILKTLDPVDLHKVDSLRQRIAAGDYHAAPGELADQLMDLLGRGGPAA